MVSSWGFVQNHACITDSLTLTFPFRDFSFKDMLVAFSESIKLKESSLMGSLKMLGPHPESAILAESMQVLLHLEARCTFNRSPLMLVPCPESATLTESISLPLTVFVGSDTRDVGACSESASISKIRKHIHYV